MSVPAVEPRLTEYLYRKAAAACVPLSGTFELTPVCNMDCKMCYVRMSSQMQRSIAPLKSGKEWLELAQKAKDAGMLYLLLTGGEPFLHPDFRQILEGLHKMGLFISVNSNGTLIDEKTVEWLRDCPPVRINISLYGMDDETYGRLCGNPQGFAQTVKALKLLQEAGISVKINCSLTPYNAPQLPQMVAFADAQGVPIQVAEYMFPPVRKDPARVGENDRLDPEAAAWYTAYTRYLLLGKARFLEEGCGVADIPAQEENCREVGEGIRCRAGRCSFWITWRGEMTPCGMFPVAKSPNVFTAGFSDAWETVKERTAQIRLPAACSSCGAKDACRACAAMVLAESGSFEKVPQYRCRMTRAYPHQWQLVRKEIL